MVWSSLSDGAILQTACSASKVNTGLNNYIHGGEFVVLTNPSVTDDSRKLVLEEKDRNAAEQLSSAILDAEHLSRERVMAQARYLNLAPLTMTDEQMEKGLKIFEASLKEALEA